MNARVVGTVSSLILAAAVVACTANSRSGFEEKNDTNGTDPGAGFGGNDGGMQNGKCSFEDDTDHDGDGLSFKDGDCNDCAANIHPGLFDVSGNGQDEDCSGTPDDGEVDCDDGLDIKASDPFDAAKAMGLCKTADEEGGAWGVIEAKYVRPDGSKATPNLDVGALEGFGANNPPQAGKSMFVISTGYARAPGDPGFQSGQSRSKGTSHGAPDGYPKEFAGCDSTDPTGDPHDGIGLELKIRVPKNAKSFTYDQNFFTHEYSTYVCTRFNDFYVALLQPKLPELADENIAFDSLGNPISVNNGLLQACSPGDYKGKHFDCPLGLTPLDGTGFEGRGATGWLTTTAPVEGGSIITLRFAIWDSGDGGWDSTALIDNFKWSVDGAGGPATSPVK